MEERIYHLRMQCDHVPETNEVHTLTLQMEVEDGWETMEFSMAHSSPYRIFLFASFLCQNSYLYMNATERGLSLLETRGQIRIHTEDFAVKSMQAEFEVSLRAGEPTAEDVEFICTRMLACPVSRSLTSTRKTTTLRIADHTFTAG